MRRTSARLALGGLTALALVCGLAFPARAQKESKAVAEVRALNQQLIADYVARDAEKVMSHYWNSPQLLAVSESGAPLQGWDENRKATHGFLDAAESVTIQCPEWSYWSSGDGVVGTCAFKLGARMKGGQEMKEAGWYTNYRRKTGGKWLIVFEHTSVNPPAPPAPSDSLYKRLGGYDALAAVSDDFLGRLASDAQLGRFFQGVSKAHVQSIRQHVVDFLCMATGGPCVYVGRDMKSTHAGLGISGADWNRMVGLLVQTLDKFNVPERERKDVLGALGGLKGDIVDKP